MRFVRFTGIFCGVILAESILHISNAEALSLKASTMEERIGAVIFGVTLLSVLVYLVKRIFSAAFVNGFLVATGLFLSFDIVMFHWIFQLHRVTNGPEANVLEPIFVMAGVFLTVFGLRRELSGESIHRFMQRWF